MPDDDRRVLADQQARIVQALTGGGGAESPEGFDAGRIALTARTLRQKRARAIAKCWPAITDGLKGSFGELFEVYAASHVLPATPVEDCVGFARWLMQQQLLGDTGRMQLLLNRAARGWPIRMMRLSSKRHLAIAVRIPIFGVCHILIRMPERSA
jgi:hypothetical protein